MIASDLFDVRGPLTSRLRRDLSIRGTSIQLQDLWGRHGWEDRSEGAAGVVVELTPVTGRVKGVRWATGGNLITGTFKVHHLYPKAVGVEAVVAVRGETLTWPTAGEHPRNFSDWISLGQRPGELSLKAADGSPVSREAQDEMEIREIRFRASLTLLGVDGIHVSGHVMGETDDDLEDILRRWGLQHGERSPNIPTIGVREEDQRTFRRVRLMLTEPEGTGLGFGILPALEEVSAEESPVCRDEVEEQLCLFLRQAGMANNVKGHWPSAMRKDSAPTKKNLTLIWPAYWGPTDTNAGTIVRPTAVTVTKYSGVGSYTGQTLEALDIPTELRELLLGSMNASLAQRTWLTYQTAYRRFVNSLLVYDIMEPSVVTVRHLLIFVGVLLQSEVKAATINSYLSGVRKVVEARGAKLSEDDMALVRAAVKGQSHKETKKPFRQLMSVELMVHLKTRLAQVRETVWSRHNKRVFWLLVTWLFWSSCRGGEMAMETESQFDPRNNLLWRDVRPTEEGDCVSLTLRSPKEVRGLQNVEVELYRVGGDLCPIMALQRFQERSKLGEDPELPVFRWDSGRNITLKKMNAILRDLLKDKLKYEEGNLGIHCFRNSIPSLMKQLGYPEDEIKAQGRWTSEAFLNYVKLSKEKKAAEKRKLAGDINRRVARLR